VRYLPGAEADLVIDWYRGIELLYSFSTRTRWRRDFHKRENKVGFTWEWYLLELMFSPQTFPRMKLYVQPAYLHRLCLTDKSGGRVGGRVEAADKGSRQKYVRLVRFRRGNSRYDVAANVIPRT